MAGFAGTAVMTVFSYLSKYLHLQQTDFHGMITNHFHVGGFMTWVVYFGFGAALAYIYGAYFRHRLPAHSWQRGMIYALVLWGFMHMVMMPVFGMGFFSGSIMGAVAAYFGMALYGGTVGYLYEH